METEKKKMLAGKMYNPADPVLSTDRKEARQKVRIYNQTLETEGEKRDKLLKELLGSTGENVSMEPNIRFDYGYNTYVGDNFYANLDLRILEVVGWRLGSIGCLAPVVQSFTPKHPLIPTDLNQGKDKANRISLGTMVGI